MKSKSMKGLKNAHTSNSQIGSGDYYGSGVKQKVGKVRQNMLNFVAPSPKKLKSPPRSLA